MKIFTYPELSSFKKTFLDRSFDSVQIFKPEASRSESAEMYWMYVSRSLHFTSSPLFGGDGVLTKNFFEGMSRCKGFKGDVVGQLIEAPEVVEEQKWMDT